MRTRLAFSWLLALFLLWGQATAFAHALEHVDEGKTHAPCELCVGQAQLGGNAPPSLASAFVASAGPAAVFSNPGMCRVARTLPRPCARGPPASPFV